MCSGRSQYKPTVMHGAAIPAGVWSVATFILATAVLVKYRRRRTHLCRVIAKAHGVVSDDDFTELMQTSHAQSASLSAGEEHHGRRLE